MKKNFWLGAMAAVTLLATSCQNDEYSMENRTSVVSFTLEQPSISTRGYSDGTTATKLEYAVYATGATTSLITGVETLTDGKATVEITFGAEAVDGVLPHGTYDFVFWAAAEDAPYTFNENSRNVTVNDYNIPTDNADKRDAFFAIRNGVEVGAEGVLETITLTRPFAQLNFGAIDEMITMTPKQSSVKVKVYETLNLKDGSVGGAAERTFAMTDIPQSKGESFPVNGVNQYLSMSYLLVPADAELINNVEFTLSDGAETNPQTIIKTFSNVPVRRNYRTNIYGQMNAPAANQATFVVEIDEEYDKPAFNRSGVTAGGNYYETIADAIAAGETVIELGEDSYVLPVAQNMTLKFIGAGSPEKTKIHLDKINMGALTGSEVTFENLTIVPVNGKYQGFQHIAKGIYKNCIIENLIFLYGESEFDNCTFNVEGDNYNVWTYGAPKATFTNCTFNCDAKAVLIYTEGKITAEHIFDRCTFNDSGKLDELKAAIEIGESADGNKANYTVRINSCEVNGFAINDEGISTGTNKWGNKNSMSADQLDIYIDGTEVY